MPHPLCYTLCMIIKSDMIHTVTYKLTPKATLTRTAHVRAQDCRHAVRIVESLFKGTRRGFRVVGVSTQGGWELI